jgi:regulator of PEP synthase PpsR (kinase-PPPase family)
MKRTAFFISDGTGITAETLGQSLLAQFDGIDFRRLTRPYIDTAEKAQAMVQQINEVAEADQLRPIVFDTIVNSDISNILSTANAFKVDVFASFISPLEEELNARSSYSVGTSHSITHSANYIERIDAVHFALENDDGGRTRHYDSADIILVGVSRCGKTPTCLYMAMQYGIRAANYPLTEDDMESLQLPSSLRKHQEKLFGLTIDADRLAAIRNERKPNSRYASYAQCEFEVREVEALFKRENINFINTTHFSVEEISAKILVEKGIERRFK